MFPYKTVDLTHPLNSQVPSWNGGCGFWNECKLDYDDCKDNVKFKVQQIKMHSGLGTHIDAPAHCIPQGLDASQLSLSNLCRPCIVIDVSSKAHESYLVSMDDIKLWELENGQISSAMCVFIYTGWSKHWDNPLQYRNNLIFPSVSEEVARYLLDRNISGLGIDTMSPDCTSSGYPVHHYVLGAGKYIIENVANLDLMPNVGAFSMALPLPIQDGTESPARLIGLI
jgi:kynurenine formamidase